MKTPQQPTLYNLEQYVSSNGKECKTHTLVYNVPYGLAKGMLNKANAQRHLPGTFFKIVPNQSQIKQVAA